MKPSELLSDPSKWTQGAASRDKNGNKILLNHIFSPDAQCYCLLGALEVCKVLSEARKKLYLRIGTMFPRSGGHFISFNDDLQTTYEDVIYVLEACDL